jgi:dUTP pyrophosphatase
MNVKIINKGTCPLPSYETVGAAGMDVRANLSASVCVSPGERMLVPTGLYLEVPAGLECQVRPRSGLALKKGITVLNTPGTIDSDYRGEWMAIFTRLEFNTSSGGAVEDFPYGIGDRVAQIYFEEVLPISFEIVSELEQSERGEGAFGSTGLK